MKYKLVLVNRRFRRGTKRRNHIFNFLTLILLIHYQTWYTIYLEDSRLRLLT